MISVFRSSATFPFAYFAQSAYSADLSDSTFSSMLSTFGNDSDSGTLSFCFSTFRIRTGFHKPLFNTLLSYKFHTDKFCLRAKGSTNGKKDILFCVSLFRVISVNVSMSFHEFHIELCFSWLFDFFHHTQDAQAESAPLCLPDFHFMAKAYRPDRRIAFHFNIKNRVFSLNVRSFIHQTAVENPSDFSLPLNMSLARNKGRIRNHFDAVLFKNVVYSVRQLSSL